MVAAAQVRLVERGSLQQERAQLAEERAELNQGLSQVGAWHPTIRDHLRDCRALRLMLSGPVPGRDGWLRRMQLPNIRKCASHHYKRAPCTSLCGRSLDVPVHLTIARTVNLQFPARHANSVKRSRGLHPFDTSCEESLSVRPVAVPLCSTGATRLAGQGSSCGARQ